MNRIMNTQPEKEKLSSFLHQIEIAHHEQEQHEEETHRHTNTIQWRKFCFKTRKFLFLKLKKETSKEKLLFRLTGEKYLTVIVLTFDCETRNF